MNKRFMRLIVLCMSAMIVLGGLSFAYATVNVQVEENQSSATKIELINSDGECVRTWILEEKGPLVKELEPGTYTLREVVEINGYEIPAIPTTWNTMLGCGVIIPADALDPEPPTPSFTPLPEDIYDDFWDWINTLES